MAKESISESPEALLSRLRAQLDHAATLADVELRQRACNLVIVRIQITLADGTVLTTNQRADLLTLDRLAKAERAVATAEANARPLPFGVRQ